MEKRRQIVKLYRLFILILFVLLLLLRQGCIDIPSKLVAPSWDMEMNIPLIKNRTYTLDEIIKRQNYLYIQPSSGKGSIYLLQTDKFTQSISVAKFVQINDSSSEKNISVIAANNDCSVFYLPMPQNVVLDSADFTGGRLNFSFQNQSNNQVVLLMLFPGIIQSDGSGFFALVSIPPAGISTLTHELSGGFYKRPSNQKSENYDKLEVIVKPFVSGSAVINMDYNCSALKFSYASGILPEKSIGKNSQAFVMDFGNIQGFRGMTKLKNAELYLNISYISQLSKFFNFEVKNLNVEGIINNGNPVYLTDSKQNKNLDILVKNGSYNYSFTQDNSNITDFISAIPDRINISGEYIMNPDGQNGEASIYDAVRLQTEFSTSSYISLNNACITDTSNIDLTSDDINNISKINDAMITLEITNGIPLADSLKIVFIDSLGKDLFTLRDTSGNEFIYFPGADISADGEHVTDSVSSKISIALNSSEIKKFCRAYKIIYTLKLSTSNVGNSESTAVAIRPEYKLSIRAYGSINYHLSPK